MDKLLYSPAEAAARLGIGRTKVYELLATGQLPAVRLGGKIFVSASALSEFAMSLPTYSPSKE